MFFCQYDGMIYITLEGMFNHQRSLSKTGKCVWGLADLQRSRYIELTHGQSNLGIKSFESIS